MDQINKDFVFIRHCKTNWDHNDIESGYKDLELNDVGIVQASNIHKVIIKNLQLEDPIIFSSNLKRADQTAEMLASDISYKNRIIKIEGLKERVYSEEIEEKFNMRVNAAFSYIFKYINEVGHTGSIIVVSHQKVFEFMVRKLVGEHLKLNFGQVCHFKIVDGNYSANIY